jgi:succinate dehydrogenase / fumarate reductase membrane anchor subunit
MVSRIVTGAHYGLGDWLVQRISGVVMAVYTVILLGFLVSQPAVTYGSWKALFAQGWMRIATLLFAVSLGWHAWVGMRDILMDYIKPTGLRLAMEVGTVVLIAVYVAWTVQILWR